MVKKLLKHELYAYARVMWVVFAIFTAFSVFGRLVQLFEADSIIYNIVFAFTIMTFIIGAFAVLVFGEVLAVVRFYRHLFSGEGYLSFTLPVTPAQHIFVKMCAAIVVQLVSLLVILLAGNIFVAGDVGVELWKAGAYLFGQLVDLTGWHLPLFILEWTVAFWAIFISCFATYYMCISIGQLFNRVRILAAIGAYAALTFAAESVWMVLNIVFALVSPQLPWEALGEWIAAHPFAWVHILFIAIAVVPLILAAVMLWVTHRIIQRRLNLE